MVHLELQRLLDVDAKVGFDQIAREVTLGEPGKGGGTKIRDFIIGGLSDDALVCKFDCKERTTEYFNKSYPDVHSGCDYLIYTTLNEKKYLLACELKSNCIKGFDRQIVNTLLFWDYIAEILRTHRGLDISDTQKIAILFSTAKIKKTRTNGKFRKTNKNGLSYIDAGNPLRVNISRLIESYF